MNMPLLFSLTSPSTNTTASVMTPAAPRPMMTRDATNCAKVAERAEHTQPRAMRPAAAGTRARGGKMVARRPTRGARAEAAMR